MSAEAQQEPDPSLLPGPGSGLLQQRTVFKASLVKYWTQRCADKRTSLHREQWQGYSCVFWYPCYLFLGFGKVLKCTGAVQHVWFSRLKHTYTTLMQSLFDQCILRQVKSILCNPFHFLYSEYKPSSSGSRYRAQRCMLHLFKNSFVSWNIK